MMDDSVAYESLPINGLVGKLRDDLMHNCDNNPKFAMGCALLIIGSICQRSFIVPDQFDTNLFVLLHTCASNGKDSFFARTEAYLNAVDPRLLSPEPRSGEAFKVLLSEHPTRCYVVDEFWKKYAGAYQARPEPFAYGIMSKMLELYNNRELLKGSKTKTSFIPDTQFPRFSLLGVATYAGLQKVLKEDDFSQDGMMSRFCLFIYSKVEFKRFKRNAKPRSPISDKIVEDLQKLYYGPGPHAHSFTDGKLPAPLHHSELILTDDTDLALDGVWERFNERYKTMTNEELVEGGHAIVCRNFNRVQKFTAIHCLGRGDTVMSREDVAFAGELGVLLLDQDMELMDAESAGIHDRVILAIEKVLEKDRTPDGLNGAQIANKTRTLRKALKDEHERMRILKAMAGMGRINMVDNPGDPAPRFFRVIPVSKLRALI